MLRLGLSMFALSALALGLLSSQSACSDNTVLSPCKSSRDCEDGYSCVNKLCHKTCGKDSDCSDTGEKCIQSFCGGRRGYEKSTTDGGPQPVCTPGETKSCYDGPQGTDGTGICKTGTQLCNDDGQWDKCQGQVVPLGFEECNGKDDDCNGKVDDNCGTSCTLGATRPCYTGPDNTKGVGPCKAGKETCEKGPDGKPAWGQCNGQILPQPPENCKNQIDDDCNGKVNDGCDCTPGQTRDCKADNGCAGIQSCQVKGGGSKWGICVASKPHAESCNGLDDDCDGQVDEDETSGKALTRKCLNVCFEGIETCTNGKWKNCTAELPKDEICNNKDDDCDGKIDNIKDKDKPLLKACKTGKPGLCDTGRQECKAGKWGSCIIPKPQPENCNDLDDDCDGQVDEAADKPCGDGAKCIKDTLGVKKCVSG